MDFVILYFAMRFSEKRVQFSRIALGAGVGAVYSAAAVAVPVLSSFFVRIVVSAAMCLCLRRPKPFRPFLRTLLVFYAVTFVFGGAVLAAMYFFARESFGGSYLNLPVLRHILMGGVPAILLLEYISRRHYPRPGGPYLIHATLAGEDIQLEGFVDTGNQLTDFSGRSIIIAKKDKILSQLSPPLREQLLSGTDTKIKTRRFYFSTIAGEGSLFSFLPDTLHIQVDEKKYLTKTYIALSEEDFSREYSAILGPRLLLIKL